MKNCKHPKKYITITEENSYTDEGYGCDRYVKVQQWKCTKCGTIQDGNLERQDNLVLYKYFTGRDYNEDFKREIKSNRIKRAREKLRQAQRELKEALNS